MLTEFICAFKEMKAQQENQIKQRKTHPNGPGYKKITLYYIGLKSIYKSDLFCAVFINETLPQKELKGLK